MNKVHKGSCLCKAVNFEITGEFENFYLCHCQHCRKDSGSNHASNLFSTTAELKWLSGENNIQTYHLPQTRHVKSFCKSCGSAVPNIQMAGQLLVVPAGSLDTKLVNKPDAHIFVASKAMWDQNLDNLPEFDGLPD